jgi:hypothetical protein
MTSLPICESLLRNMEALVVGCRGGFRPHLRALHFGGAAKLARELAAFLNSGAIHRDKVNNIRSFTLTGCTAFALSKKHRNTWALDALTPGPCDKYKSLFLPEVLKRKGTSPFRL